MKKIIKMLLRKIVSIFQKKIPIKYPVYEGILLKDKTILITGGSSGIGYSMAELFLKNGANVIITGRNEKKLKEAISKLEKISNDRYVKYYVLDNSDIASMKKNINDILLSNSINILVNNAGTGIGKSIGETNEEDFDCVYNTNVKGTYFISQETFNYFKNNKIKGNILNITSSSSIRPATTPYSISKWGLIGFTKGLAKKAIQYDIVVNGLAPGPTATPMLKNNIDNINLESSPSGRYIMPEEIANAAMFLISDMGRMVVGDTLFMTGGAGTITFDDIQY